VHTDTTRDAAYGGASEAKKSRRDATAETRRAGYAR
jgi:hypothetical protein